jgi:hypothetical protein
MLSQFVISNLSTAFSVMPKKGATSLNPSVGRFERNLTWYGTKTSLVDLKTPSIPLESFGRLSSSLTSIGILPTSQVSAHCVIGCVSKYASMKISNESPCAFVFVSKSAETFCSNSLKDLMESKCPDCGGKLVAESELNEEGNKDACYHKVKSRYKVWPSAYASGALVKCRKVGASNWGNKSK